MVEFNSEWYRKLIENSSEKVSLVNVIKELLGKRTYGSCLDIGLGLYPFFAQQLSSNFKKYTIIEKEKIIATIPKNVKIVYDDWEDIKLNDKFDHDLALEFFSQKSEKYIDCLIASNHQIYKTRCS